MGFLWVQACATMTHDVSMLLHSAPCGSDAF